MALILPDQPNVRIWDNQNETIESFRLIQETVTELVIPTYTHDVGIDVSEKFWNWVFLKPPAPPKKWILTSIQLVGSLDADSTKHEHETHVHRLLDSWVQCIQHLALIPTIKTITFYLRESDETMAVIRGHGGYVASNPDNEEYFITSITKLLLYITRFPNLETLHIKNIVNYTRTESPTGREKLTALLENAPVRPGQVVTIHPGDCANTVIRYLLDSPYYLRFHLPALSIVDTSQLSTVRNQCIAHIETLYIFIRTHHDNVGQCLKELRRISQSAPANVVLVFNGQILTHDAPVLTRTLTLVGEIFPTSNATIGGKKADWWAMQFPPPYAILGVPIPVSITAEPIRVPLMLQKYRWRAVVPATHINHYILMREGYVGLEIDSNLIMLDDKQYVDDDYASMRKIFKETPEIDIMNSNAKLYISIFLGTQKSVWQLTTDICRDAVFKRLELFFDCKSVVALELDADYITMAIAEVAIVLENIERFPSLELIRHNIFDVYTYRFPALTLRALLNTKRAKQLLMFSDVKQDIDFGTVLELLLNTPTWMIWDFGLIHFNTGQTSSNTNFEMYLPHIAGRLRCRTMNVTIDPDDFKPSDTSEAKLLEWLNTLRHLFVEEFDPSRIGIDSESGKQSNLSDLPEYQQLVSNVKERSFRLFPTTSIEFLPPGFEFTSSDT